MFEVADNYDPLATIQDSSCIISGCSEDWADNYSPHVNTDDGSCFKLGCMNNAFLEFDENATISDESMCMTPIILGCNDTQALNYNLEANKNDGSCTYPFNSLTLEMYDSYGDGWNDGYLALINENGEVINAYTMYTGSNESNLLHLNNGCYNITVEPGEWPEEISWNLLNSIGEVIAYGGAPYSGSFCIEENLQPGCTEITSNNYDSDANIYDASCITDASNCDENTSLYEYENTQINNIASVGDIVYYSGTFSGVVDFGNHRLVAQSSEDVFVVKTLNCEVLWARQLTASSIGNSALVATEDYVILGGSHSSTVTYYGEESFQYIEHTGGVDGYVVKINSNGEYIWDTKISGGSNEGVVDITVDQFDKVYLSGYYNGCCPSFFEATISSSQGNSITLDTPPSGEYYGSGYVSKLDAAGNPIWAFEAWGRDLSINNIEVFNNKKVSAST